LGQVFEAGIFCYQGLVIVDDFGVKCFELKLSVSITHWEKGCFGRYQLFQTDRSGFIDWCFFKGQKSLGMEPKYDLSMLVSEMMVDDISDFRKMDVGFCVSVEPY
jgi:hypothetical protein